MSLQPINLLEAEKYIKNNINLQIVNNSKGISSPIIYLSGPPGCGKSSLMEQIAIKLDMSLNVKYLSTMLIEQISGLPIPSSDKKEYNWSKPELFSENSSKIKGNSSKTILFLDDAHLCSKSIQSYLFQLLTYHSIHDHKLSDSTIIILAGNRAQDRSGAQPIMAPIVNRLLFLDTATTTENWVKDFAVSNGVRNDVISFLEFYPDLLSSEPLESASFASPRSWTYFSLSLDQLESEQEITTNDYLTLGRGHIGQEYAGKFTEYKKLFCKWNAKDFLSEKNSLPNFSDLSKIDCYTLMSSITSEFIKNLRMKNYDSSNEEIQNQIKVVSELFNKLIINAKEIIPLGLRLIYLSENAKTKQANIFMSFMKTNPALLEAAKTILNVKK